MKVRILIVALLLLGFVGSNIVAQSTKTRKILYFFPDRKENAGDQIKKRQSIVSLSLGGSVRLWNDQAPESLSTVNAGGSFTLDYTYKFSAHWGVSTGVGLNVTLGKSRLENTFEDTKIDEDNDEFWLTTAVDLTEKQRFYHIQIPVNAYYEAAVGPALGISVKAGIQANIPLSATYRVKSGSVDASAYYPAFDLELDDVSWLGYGHTDDFSSKGEIQAKFHVSALLEVGMHIFSKRGPSLIYVGAYAEIGMQSFVKASTGPLFADALTYRGLFNTQIAEGLNFRSFGVKMAIPLHKTKFRQ